MYTILNIDHLGNNLGGLPLLAHKLLEATFTTVAHRPFVFWKCTEHLIIITAKIESLFRLTLRTTLYFLIPRILES